MEFVKRNADTVNQFLSDENIKYLSSLLPANIRQNVRLMAMETYRDAKIATGVDLWTGVRSLNQHFYQSYCKRTEDPIIYSRPIVSRSTNGDIIPHHNGYYTIQSDEYDSTSLTPREVDTFLTGVFPQKINNSANDGSRILRNGISRRPGLRIIDENGPCTSSEWESKRYTMDPDAI